MNKQLALPRPASVLVLRNLVKTVVGIAFLALAWPAAALTGFGRFKGVYSFFAHSFALSPGIPGAYLRAAFYRLTLSRYELSSRIQFGSFFAHPEARVAANVYIGSYCILARTEIGERTQIASSVQILSGSRQHVRDESGRISGSDTGVFTPVKIGADCWIGAGAIVMADVGSGSTIGAGSVVTRPIPPGSIAVGSPARIKGSLDEGIGLAPREPERGSPVPANGPVFDTPLVPTEDPAPQGAQVDVPGKVNDPGRGALSA